MDQIEIVRDRSFLPGKARGDSSSFDPLMAIFLGLLPKTDTSPLPFHY